MKCTDRLRSYSDTYCSIYLVQDKTAEINMKQDYGGMFTDMTLNSLAESAKDRAVENGLSDSVVKKAQGAYDSVRRRDYDDAISKLKDTRKAIVESMVNEVASGKCER